LKGDIIFKYTELL